MKHQKKEVLWEFTVGHFFKYPGSKYQDRCPWGSLGHAPAPFSELELLSMCLTGFKLKSPQTGMWHLTIYWIIGLWSLSKSETRLCFLDTIFLFLWERFILGLVPLFLFLLDLPHHIICAFRQAPSEMAIDIQLWQSANRELVQWGTKSNPFIYPVLHLHSLLSYATAEVF